MGEFRVTDICAVRCLHWAQIATFNHELLYFIQDNSSGLHTSEAFRHSKPVHMALRAFAWIFM